MCLAILLAGLLTWGMSYWLEPKLYLITGNLESFSISGLGATSRYVPSSQEVNLTKEDQVAGEIGNSTLVLLMARYGNTVNISRTIRAVVEDQSGSRIGTGYVINTDEGQKLVVVLPDGWMHEYALPAKG